MKREWKPGDVALVEVRTTMNTRKERGVAYLGMDGLWHLPSGAKIHATRDDLIKSARPLVVIDPEDREQVERLADIFCDAPSLGGWVMQMQAALREFADPKPPKPEEPLGIGAVIEDSDGRHYARIAVAGDALAHDHEWFVIGGSANTVRTFGYDQIDVVRVLSDGWAGEDA